MGDAHDWEQYENGTEFGLPDDDYHIEYHVEHHGLIEAIPVGMYVRIDGEIDDEWDFAYIGNVVSNIDGNMTIQTEEFAGVDGKLVTLTWEWLRSDLVEVTGTDRGAIAKSLSGIFEAIREGDGAGCKG